MQVMEFSRGSGSALTLSLAPDSAEAFAQELRQVKAALLDWHSKQGSRCELIMLTVVSAPEHHAAIESQIEQVYRAETELASLFQRVGVQVALLDLRGKPAKEYTLGAPSPQTRPKPWWRFW
jgi:hypothetical protein